MAHGHYIGLRRQPEIDWSRIASEARRGGHGFVSELAARLYAETEESADRARQRLRAGLVLSAYSLLALLLESVDIMKFCTGI